MTKILFLHCNLDPNSITNQEYSAHVGSPSQ